jgi:long-chain acyl-CoA synthetase
MTPIESLYQQAKARPNDTALISGEHVWTYERLAGAVEQLAGGLVRRGVRPGDRVALHMANAPELAIAYYACLCTGAIAAPLNNRFKAAEVTSLLQRLQPALYIGQADLYREVAGIDATILAPDARFIAGASSEDPRAQSWASLFDDGDKPMVTAPDIHAPAMLLTTSGTTGRPKFVAHSQASLAAAVTALEGLAPEADNIAIMTVPLVHVTGLFTLFTGIRLGGPIVMVERFDPDIVLDVIERFRVNWIGGMPFMFAALMEKQQTRARDVGSLRRCLVGGDVCPLPLQQQFAEVFGTPLRNVLGSTEALGSLTYGLELGPVSRIVEGAQVRLIDDNGIPVPQGHVGELAVRGPNVTIGYWLGPNRTECALHDDWFHTGDLLRQDENGNLWFVARKKDLIVRGGSNISPVEVENVLAAHPAVKDAAVVGVPDGDLGQRVVGFVQLADEIQSQIARQILAEISPLLADYKLPERLRIVGEISRNALGKVDRKTLLAAISKS